MLMMKEPMPELWETIYEEAAPNWLIWIEQAAIAYADLVFTVSENLKAAYVQRGANADKIRVMLNVPKPEHWLKPSPPLEHENFTLLVHGTIEDRYGHLVILDALALARKKVPEMRLRITGHGSKAAELPQRISERGLDDAVDFLSWVSHEQLIAEIRAADAGVVGLKSSPYSNLIHTNKMFEYILFQKPVLHPRLAAVSDILGADCLSYYEAGNAEDLAEKMIYLYLHSDYRQKMATSAHDCFQTSYAWDIEKGRYLQAYGELLG